MKKINLYISLTIGLVLTAILVTYYFMSLSVDKEREKGFLMTYYNPPCGPDSDYLQKLRIYQTYSLTSDSSTNELTIADMRSYLNNLKKSGDSINGVHIIMTNDMPYKFYLKSIEVFNELPPRHFFPIDNHFYAISKSKYQLLQDSINNVGYDRNGIEIIKVQ
jgi:hypothetical protein